MLSPFSIDRRSRKLLNAHPVRSSENFFAKQFNVTQWCSPPGFYLFHDNLINVAIVRSASIRGALRYLRGILLSRGICCQSVLSLDVRRCEETAFFHIHVWVCTLRCFEDWSCLLYCVRYEFFFLCDNLCTIVARRILGCSFILLICFGYRFSFSHSRFLVALLLKEKE